MKTPTLMQLNPMLCEKQRLSNRYRFRLHQLPGIDRTAPPPDPRPIRPRLPAGGTRSADREEGVGPGTRGWFHAAFAAVCLSASLGLVAVHEIHYRRAEYLAAGTTKQDQAIIRRERQKNLALAAELNAQWARQGSASSPVLQPVSYVSSRPTGSTRL